MAENRKTLLTRLREVIRPQVEEKRNYDPALMYPLATDEERGSVKRRGSVGGECRLRLHQ